MMMRLVVMVIVGGLISACGPRYTILHAPAANLVPYGGQWIVPSLEIEPRILSYYDGDEDSEEWHRNVHIAADRIAEVTKAILDDRRPEGRPMRIDMKLAEFEPARGFGMFGSQGFLLVYASFIDVQTGELVGKISTELQFARALGSTHSVAYSTIAKQVASFVFDHIY